MFSEIQIPALISQPISIVFWFLIILIPLVVIHEFGHYLMARFCGVKIPEFAVGMPLTKRWLVKRWKGTIWSFYPVLLGGFVRIWGDSDAIDEGFEVAKKDPNLAKENYVQDRFQEIISLNSLAFFLEENDLEYDENWKEFEKSNYIKQLTEGTEEEISQEEKDKYEKKFNQLTTLIKWEFDREVEGKNAFFAKSWLQQTLIISGGVLFNFLTAIFIFWMLFSFFISPPTQMDLESFNDFKPYIEVQNQNQGLRVQSVVKDSPLAQTGFTEKDELISIQGRELTSFKSRTEITDFLQTLGDQEIEIVYLNSQTEEVTTSSLAMENKDGRYLLGVGGVFYKEVEFKANNIFDGLRASLIRVSQVIRMIVSFLGDLVTSPFRGRVQEVTQSMAGPVGVAKVSNQIFNDAGIYGVLSIMALLSISLAVFNMVPIPALDGGRFVILTVNKIVGKRNKKLEGMVIGITFAVLMLLQLLIVFNDINGLFTGRFD